jgi:hypothetical protein
VTPSAGGKVALVEGDQSSGKEGAGAFGFVAGFGDVGGAPPVD